MAFHIDCFLVRMLVTLVVVATLGTSTPANGCCDRSSNSASSHQSCGAANCGCCCRRQAEQSAGDHPKSNRACCMRSEPGQRPVRQPGLAACICRPADDLPPAQSSPAPGRDQHSTALVIVSALAPVVVQSGPEFSRRGTPRCLTSHSGTALDRCIELGRFLI